MPAAAAAEPPRPGRWLTVVGISGDLKQAPNELRPLPVFFIPYAPGGYGAMTIVLRSSGDPTALAAPLRAAMRQIDPDRALSNVRTLEEVSYREGWYLRVFGSMFLIFAAGALLLASIGIYAVVAQTTVRRTQEIGVRMAMGATSPRIQRLVIARGLKQLAVGTGAGSRHRLCRHAPDGRASVRRVADRPRRVQLGDRNHRARGARRLLAAGAQGGSAGSAEGAAARMSQCNRQRANRISFQNPNHTGRDL